MKVLLDTHVFLWWASEHGRRVSPGALAVIEDPATEVYVSAASAMEIVTKAARGRLELPAAPEAFVPSRLSRHGFLALPIEIEHGLRAGTLPDAHRDPWDRLLIAQSQAESMPIVTADPLIGQYDVDVIW